MNFDQVKSIISSLLMIAGTYLVSSGKISPDDWTSITQAIGVILPAAATVGLVVWKTMGHTDAAKMEIASHVPDTAKVEIASHVAGAQVVVDTRVASPDLAAMAKNPAIPDVVAK